MLASALKLQAVLSVHPYTHSGSVEHPINKIIIESINRMEKFTKLYKNECQAFSMVATSNFPSYHHTLSRAIFLENMGHKQ